MCQPLSCINSTHFALITKNEFLIKENDKEEKFYPSSDENSEVEETENDKQNEKMKQYVMDSDHRLLLRSAKPLLQSRNAAVSFEEKPLHKIAG